LDDLDITKKLGGQAYSSYGIEPAGAIVILRPDGYVGMVAPLDGLKDLDTYFAGFLKASSL